MRSMFTSTFQPARKLQGYRPVFSAPARPALGAAVSEAARTALLDKVQTGENRLAAVRKWIASRIDLDPMLLRTFGQQHVSDNFWGYSELVEKDQYYVDQAVQILNDDLSGWDVSEEISSRTDEWATAIDIMYGAMQQYGKTPLTTPAGAPIQNTVAPTTGGTVPPATPTGGGKIPAGASVNTPPPSTGFPTKEVLLYGGIGLGALALIAIIKKYA